MKNKKFTYLLGFLVLAVWGIIIYRIFITVNTNEEVASPNLSTSIGKEPYDDYAATTDTARLSLHYRDPFADSEIKDTTKVKMKVVTVSTPPKLVPRLVNFSFIRYAGYIRNPGSRQLLALMTVNGKSLSLQEGETRENIKLLKNMQDSVKIAYNGAVTFLKITANNP